jgi:hypothetical protein
MMSDTIDPKILDKRVAERYMRKGLLDEKDLEQHLKKLPDLAEQALEIESEIENAGPSAPG